MASRVERGPHGVVYRAAEMMEVPQMDLLTLIFDSSHSGSTETTLLHVDAAEPSRSITKAQLRHQFRRVAHTLGGQYGIGNHGRDSDVVMCISTGHYHLSTLFYAVVAAGGVFSASSPGSTSSELAEQLRQLDARLLFCTADTKEAATAAARSVGMGPDRVLVFNGDEANLFSMKEAVSDDPIAISQELLDWERITDTTVLENSIICILFSSGTTGRPKGVRLSHTNIAASAYLVMTPLTRHYAVHNPAYQMRTLAHLPAAHIAGIQGYLVNPAYFGGTVYWMPRFDFAQFLAHCRAHRITSFFSVPPVFLLLAKSPLVTDQFDSLDNATSGAAPMGPSLQEAVSRRLGRGRGNKGEGWSIAQTWGMSETTGAITVMPKGVNDETGSVSMLIANHEARIVDDAGRDVEPGLPGEIWVRGPVVTKGYYGNPEATSEAFVDGWLCTGDIGYFRDGKFYIIDRKKELIKYKGFQVAPAELEAILLSHPEILDVAVVGVQDEGTEVPRAYVVADARKVKPEDIAAWLNSQVAGHKRLRGGVVFIQAIPKSPSGKTLRKALREMAKDEGLPAKL